MNLADVFTQSAKQRSEKVAVFWGESGLTYATLLAQSLAVARQLTEKFGVQPGDRVGLWLKNRPEFIPGLFGILNAEAVVVPINNFFKPAEVSHILSDAGIEVLITDEELGVHFPALASTRPSLRICKIEEVVAANSEIANCKLPIVNRTESDLLSLISVLSVLMLTNTRTGLLFRPKTH